MSQCITWFILRGTHKLSHLRTALFDLDGTLLDTAPDLLLAINKLRAEYNLPDLPNEMIRYTVSHGTPLMLKVAFGIDTDHVNFSILRTQLLAYYQRHLTEKTSLFTGMAEVLANLEAAGMNWGVVTNKPAFLTNPIMANLGLAQRAVTVVSGDTTPFFKPHPAPLLYACKAAGSQPHECVFIGDAKNDILAGRAAGTATLVALFGYLSIEDRPEEWGADGLIENPAAIIKWINAKQGSLNAH